MLHQISRSLFGFPRVFSLSRRLRNSRCISDAAHTIPSSTSLALPQRQLKGHGAINCSSPPCAEEVVWGKENTHEGESSGRQSGRFGSSSVVYAAIVAAIALTASAGPRPILAEENRGKAPSVDGEGMVDSWKKKWKEFQFKLYNPLHEQEGHVLLPPPQADYLTLVIDLKDFLYADEVDGRKRWRKRPGTDEFLRVMAQMFEVILWCSGEDSVTDDGHARQLNSSTNAFTVVLLYAHNTYTDGKLVKDLTRLNRNPTRLLHLTSNPDAASFQPENAVHIKPWDGSSEDTGLYDLCFFLEYVYAKTDISTDIRTILARFQGKDVEEMFRRVREGREKKMKEKAQKKSFGIIPPMRK